MAKEFLLGKTLDELKLVCSNLGLPSFTAKQIAQWLYQKNVFSMEEMTNLSKESRAKLSEHFDLGRTTHTKVQESVDGTKKYLFPTEFNKFVESAYIPDKDRATLCLSSQVGCKMGCLFCMTGKQGFQGQLTATEILNQVISLPEREKLTNLVYMGMGEPLDNLEELMKSIEILTSEWGLAMSPRRITVSTIGLIPAMKHFLENSEAHLAVSMHTPFDEERKNLMPIETIYPIQEVVDAIKTFDFSGQRRVSFEYIMFKGVNDQDKHIDKLVELLKGIKCRINLIRFHPIPDTPLEGTSLDRIQEFKEKLNKRGILTTIRASRGEDIYAACGLLSTKELVKQKDSDF